MRALAKIAVPAVALALLAGCGGDDETTTTTSPETSAGATGPTGAEETTTPHQPEGDGGEGGGSSPSAGSTPEDALEAFFVSGDPDVACGEVVTPELVESAYGDERGCRQAQVPGAAPESIEVVELDESGETAEAVVIPNGGPNDGFEHEVTLVREGDDWRLDSLEADIPAGP